MVWTQSGIVTLLTDFGTTDPYVGVMKGVLFARAPRLRAAIDLTHEVPPQDVRAASFYLLHSWQWFPAGTVHCVVVDPGVGTERRIVAALDRGHAFLAPDNGLLDGVLSPEAEVRALDVERFSLPARSRTFHGRDVFAPAAAALAEGLSPCAAGEPLRLPGGSDLPVPSRDGEDWRGEVVLVDRFGNLVTNLGAGLTAGGACEVELRGQSLPLFDTYSDAAPGAALALVSSFGTIEVAQAGGSAARLLGCSAGEPVWLRRRG